MFFVVLGLSVLAYAQYAGNPEGKIILWEAVAEPSEEFPTCHCSDIVELVNGDILVTYYAGPGEAKPGEVNVLARRRLGAESFDPLQVIAETPGKPQGNGILFQTKDGTLLFIYVTLEGKLYGPSGPGVRWSTGSLQMKRSQDNGRTWSEPDVIDKHLGSTPRNNPIQLENGDIIFGTEHWLVHSHPHFFISHDGGLTWEVTREIPGEETEQPAIIQRSDGSLLAFLRPSGDIPKIFRSVSIDGGITWSPAENTEIDCPWSAVRLLRLSDNRVILAWNNHPSLRNNITLAMSMDEGKTWPYVRELISGEGEFCYPALMEDRNGFVHLTFTNNYRTIDHVVFTPEWIMGEGAGLKPWDEETKKRELLSEEESPVLQEIENYHRVGWMVSPEEVKQAFLDKSFIGPIEEAGGAISYSFRDVALENNVVISFVFLDNELFMVRIFFEEAKKGYLETYETLETALEEKYGKPQEGNITGKNDIKRLLFAKGYREEFVDLSLKTEDLPIQIKYAYHDLFAKWLRNVELEEAEK